MSTKAQVQPVVPCPDLTDALDAAGRLQSALSLLLELAELRDRFPLAFAPRFGADDGFDSPQAKALRALFFHEGWDKVLFRLVGKLLTAGTDLPDAAVLSPFRAASAAGLDEARRGFDAPSGADAVLDQLRAIQSALVYLLRKPLSEPATDARDLIDNHPEKLRAWGLDLGSLLVIGRDTKLRRMPCSTAGVSRRFGLSPRAVPPEALLIPRLAMRPRALTWTTVAVARAIWEALPQTAALQSVRKAVSLERPAVEREFRGLSTRDPGKENVEAAAKSPARGHSLDFRAIALLDEWKDRKPFPKKKEFAEALGCSTRQLQRCMGFRKAFDVVRPVPLRRVHRDPEVLPDRESEDR